jgi:hypothetical protein
MLSMTFVKDFLHNFIYIYERRPVSVSGVVIGANGEIGVHTFMVPVVLAVLVLLVVIVLLAFVG